MGLSDEVNPWIITDVDKPDMKLIVLKTVFKDDPDYIPWLNLRIPISDMLQ